jgi:hypothetical protein
LKWIVFGSIASAITVMLLCMCCCCPSIFAKCCPCLSRFKRLRRDRTAKSSSQTYMKASTADDDSADHEWMQPDSEHQPLHDKNRQSFEGTTGHA